MFQCAVSLVLGQPFVFEEDFVLGDIGSLTPLQQVDSLFFLSLIYLMFSFSVCISTSIFIFSFDLSLYLPT